MIPPRIEKILELARWAPSGDNTQPWRFEILDESSFVIHGKDTRDWCVYDLDGHASQIAIGALMENITIAASEQGLRAEFTRRSEASITDPMIDVSLVEDSSVTRDILVDFIKERVTQRRPFSTKPLTDEQKSVLAQSVGHDYRVTWIEGASPRWEMAKLLSRSAKIRLTIPEAYEVHRRIIEWNSRFSEDKIPDQSVGLDKLGLKLMRWAMRSWERVNFLNTFLAGTWIPRLQLDLAPGYFCGAHFVISAQSELNGIDDYISGGRALQRFWLTATQCQLQFQPEMTPLIFTSYVRSKRKFTERTAASIAAEKVAENLGDLVGQQSIDSGLFMGRLGTGSPPLSRSLRLPLAGLRIP